MILSFHISLIKGSKLSFEITAACYGMWCCIIRRIYDIVTEEPDASIVSSGVPRNFVRGGDSINSVEDIGHRERGSGAVSP